ncbi:MAG: hypothetical protein SGARI_001713, partial [Bacillariaceae sp.]
MKFSTATLLLAVSVPAFGYAGKARSNLRRRQLSGEDDSGIEDSSNVQDFVLENGVLAGRPEISTLQDNDLTLYDDNTPIRVDVDWNWVSDKNASDSATPTLTRYKVNGLAVDTTLWEDGTNSGNRPILLDRAGKFDLSVSVCNLDECVESDPIQVTIRDGSGVDADPIDETTSFEDAVEWARAQSQMIKQEGSKTNERKLVDPITATVVASFFGKTALSKLAGLGMDQLFGAIGWTGDDTSEKLDAITESLAAMQTQLDEIARAIQVNHADAKFDNAHRSTLESIAIIEEIAIRVSQAARGEFGEQPLETLNAWADTNSQCVAVLRRLLLDGTSGAIPLMLELLSIKHPTTGLIHVRSHIYDYVDGIRATMGIAAMNQAWLQEQPTEIGVY